MGFIQKLQEKISTQKLNDFCLLLCWIAIGCGLRFTQLTSKPPWTDEFATLVFSLGNNYQTIPLNQVISLDVLLQPLHLNADAGIADVVSLLLNEDNHPPLYFVLAHWWMQLFPSSGEYVNLWAARSLPAIFGVLSIPAIYWVGKFTFRSSLVGQLSAAMMAMSPYGIFLAQEARHYTLAILFVIASLGCLMTALKYLWQDRILPLWLVFLWVIINGFGLSVHYFFSLTLVAEIMTLTLLLGQQFINLKAGAFVSHFLATWWRLALVFIGTMTTGLVWTLAAIPRGYGNGMTDWIRSDRSDFLDLISPIFQMIATGITMVSLLPVESPSLLIVIISGVLMLWFFLWALPWLYQGLKTAWHQQNSQPGLAGLLVFLISAIALFFLLNYAFGIDLTRGARYSFIYFPSFILILSISLGNCWQTKENHVNLIFLRSRLMIPRYFLKNRLSNQFFKLNRIPIIVVLLMSFFSSITVCFNLGYQKYYRPDHLVALMTQKSSAPILIATSHKSLVQTGEMMGIAWELQQQPIKPNVSFILVHQLSTENNLSNPTLPNTIKNLPYPLDVWAINFDERLEVNGCVADGEKNRPVNGYNYHLYHCS